MLLDVNVLIALVREDHVAHRPVTRWFRRVGARRWASCAITEASFIRIVSNPRFSAPSLDISEALAMLDILRRLPGHHFWTMDIDFLSAVERLSERLFGH